MTYRLFHPAFLFAALCCGASMLAAQQPASSPDPEASSYVLRQNVRRVVLDVVVTDNEGRSVHGLQPDDFTVLENGVKQPVRSFEPHQFNSPTGVTPPKLPPLPTNTYVNLPRVAERGPLYVIVYDAVDMDPGTGVGERPHQIQARKQLMDFLAGKPAGSQFALFYWGFGLRLVQGFTTDPNELLQAFDTHRKGPHIPYTFLMGPNAGSGSCDAPFQVMTFLGHYLQGFPGRKNLIWLTSGLPSDFGSLIAMNMLETAAHAQSSSSASASSGNTSNSSGPGQTASPTGNANTVDTVEAASCLIPDGGHEMIDTLTTAQVSVYPILVGGVDTEIHGFDVNADAIAKATGGHAYYNFNNIKNVMNNIADIGSNYYEISYSPTNPKFDGKKRHIEIKLAKKGYRLSYRRFYFSDKYLDPARNENTKLAQSESGDPTAAQPNETLQAYMLHGAPQPHGIVFRLHLGAAGTPAMATPEQMANLAEQPAYLPEQRKNKAAKALRPIPLQTYTLDYAVLDTISPSRTKSAPDSQPTLEFAAAAYDADGEMLNSVSQVALVPSGPRDAHTKPMFRVHQTLEVPKEGAWLRVAVRNTATNRIGALEVPLPLKPEDSRHVAIAQAPSSGQSTPQAAKTN
jgi:VWFA-related protein